MFFTKDKWKKEWEALEKKEQSFLKKNSQEKESVLKQKLSDKIPDKLEDTLHAAFVKAFEMVFEHGTGIIEKTYRKGQHEQNYQENVSAVEQKKNRKNVKAFARQAGKSKTKNFIISGVEGAGLGILGIGVPDIPIFTAVLLKSIYEIALSYGFEYDTEEEQLFILGIIETSLLRSEKLTLSNNWLNTEIDSDLPSMEDKNELLHQAAGQLAEALLYMKFLQGIPIVGVAGGLADSVYLKKITDYADLKYRRRFLKKKLSDESK